VRGARVELAAFLAQSGAPAADLARVLPAEAIATVVDKFSRYGLKQR
jgi:hypothetical protein